MTVLIPKIKTITLNHSCKVPFLNGGLFAPLKGYEWKNEVLNIPNEFFSNSSKTGILDIFDLYNFTINETDPLDKEIGIDPEMLGKVFERLIDVNGVVYTPKIVVKNMCENVLIQYLINIKNEINLSEELITQLVKERYISDKSQLHKEVKGISKIRHKAKRNKNNRSSSRFRSVYYWHDVINLWDKRKTEYFLWIWQKDVPAKKIASRILFNCWYYW